MDHGTEKFGAMMDVPLSMKPSDYVRRQVWLTFMDDPIGAASLEAIGARHVHVGLRLPAHRLDVAQLAGRHRQEPHRRAPTTVATKVLHDNAAALYHIDV